MSQSELYVTNILDYRYHLMADELALEPDQIFLAKLKKEVEGRCIREGYVKPGSIRILSRTLGKVNQAYFTGLPVYDIKYNADICNPPVGSIITCFVKDVTKMGIICTIGDEINPLDIVVPSQLHFNNKKYVMLEPENKIKIRVLKKRHENGDNTIQIIGILHSTPFDEDNTFDEEDEGLKSEKDDEEKDDEEEEDEKEDEEKDEEGDEEEKQED